LAQLIYADFMGDSQVFFKSLIKLGIPGTEEGRETEASFVKQNLSVLKERVGFGWSRV
jgi:hypothetical protein